MAGKNSIADLPLLTEYLIPGSSMSAVPGFSHPALLESGSSLQIVSDLYSSPFASHKHRILQLHFSCRNSFSDNPLRLADVRTASVPSTGFVEAKTIEKGLTERVDARSYEERGIDKIPMVHEGPNVQAMEARGISTALGSLNRLIRALNDMKERAKNLFQWSLLRQSQLMERMLFLHQPT